MAWSRVVVGGRGRVGTGSEAGVSSGMVSHGGVPGRARGDLVSALTCWLALLDTLPPVGDARGQVTRAEDVALVA